MDEAEMRQRLEEIARQDSNRSAQIQATRLLREMDGENEEKPDEGDAKLYPADWGVRAKGSPAKSAA